MADCPFLLLQQLSNFLLSPESHLTVDNVFNELVKIAKGWRWVAEEILLISSSKCDEIAMSNTTEEVCLKEAIEFWIKRYVFSSWDFLIYRLNEKDEGAVLMKMSAKSRTGKASKLISCSTFMAFLEKAKHNDIACNLILDQDSPPPSHPSPQLENYIQALGSPASCQLYWPLVRANYNNRQVTLHQPVSTLFNDIQ